MSANPQLPPHTLPASSLLAGQGAVTRLMVGAEVRPAQLAMADAVQDALGSPGSRLVVEAPTGTGKSLAYLCAAALTRSAEDARPLRVVVATGTKALQDQLAMQDAPHLVRALKAAGLPVPSVEVVKGRRNYLCRLRLSRWQPPLALDPTTARHIQLIRGWVDSTFVGDRSEISGLPEDSPLWMELDADADACLGQPCPHYQDCFVTRLRQRAREAQIIITNHHLLCADLKLRFAENAPDAHVLPPYDALIVDEAHKLPGVAAEYFGVTVTPARFDALCRDALRVGVDGKANALKTAAMGLQREAAALFGAVGSALSTSAEATRVLFKVPEAPSVEDAAGRVLDALQSFHAQAEGLGATERSVLNECEALARRSEALFGELNHLSQASDDRFAYCAERRGARGRLQAFPSDVAELLRNTLLKESAPVVFTSATLAVNGEFRGFVSDTGLDPDSVRTLVLPTTFEADQAALYIPRDLPDPDRGPEFTAAAIERSLELIQLTGGGAFLLCTTTRAMNACARALQARLPGHLVLRQGDAPKQELLARFKTDGHAVLVATHSFWEGVDVRGQALRLVIVDKLPFAPPSDPLVAARMARAERAGRSPFNDVQVADAVILLRQGLGRLLRSRADRGILAVLDGRLWRRGYGRLVIRALGSHPTTHAWSELEAHVDRLGVRV